MEKMVLIGDILKISKIRKSKKIYIICTKQTLKTVIKLLKKN